MNDNFNQNNFPTLSEQAVSMRRRHHYRESIMTIGNAAYTVVSAFPMPYDDTSTESATDKFVYLVSGKKVNKKLSGLMDGDAV